MRRRNRSSRVKGLRAVLQEQGPDTACVRGLLSRRHFLATAGCAACGWMLGDVGAHAGDAEEPAPPTWTREIDYYEQLSENRIQCFVCPLHCVLKDGETCFCRTRTNVGGKLFTRAYHNPCLLEVDPIEKLPLNHFRPGSSTLTLGIGGCNLRCLYCQNWEQSQKMPDELKTFTLTPADVVAQARKKKIDTIAFSYTEPIAFLEYALDVARAAKAARLRVVVATAAFVDATPLLEFAKYVDAFIVSLKGFDEDFYYRVCGVQLAPILAAIETIKTRTKCWLELLNLVVPSYNDELPKIEALVAWVFKHLGPDVPLHFARFSPTYKLANLPRTPVQTLEVACEAARQAGLRYVYTSNIAPHEGTHTRCANCSQTVVQRLGFKILQNDLNAGACPGCRRKLPGVWT